jgi:hypothetical protein
MRVFDEGLSWSVRLLSTLSIILGFILRLFEKLFGSPSGSGRGMNNTISVTGPVKHCSVQFGFGTLLLSCCSKNMLSHYMECL